MRTTLRIDADLLKRLKRLADSEQNSLTQVVNRLLRQALNAPAAPRGRFQQESFLMGREKYDLTKSLHLANELENEEIGRKLSLRK